MTTDTLGDYSDDTTNTYAQIVVPTYALENPLTSSEDGGTTSGSSFIRLGSFPSLTDATEQPDGFANSLKLAQLVAGTAQSYPTTTAAQASNLGETTSDAAAGALLSTSDYAGDPAYLLGFVDDIRYRGADDALNPATLYVDWTTVDNTVANRQAETSRLLFKGGWWDHADGNRISTTSGDKVEVIQGNYKLVVLGRQEGVAGYGNAASFDMSGGHVVDQDAAPNANVMCVEYVKDGDVWTVVEDNGSGNLTEIFNGEHKELFTGSKKESYVGLDPTNETHRSRSHKDDKVQGPDKAKDPKIIDKTWAQSISTYVGSDGKPVPSIYTYTAAGAINDVTFASEVTSTTTAVLVMETTVGVKVEIVAVLATEISTAKYEYIGIKDVVTEENTEVSALKTELHTLKEAVGITSNQVVQAVLNIADVETDLTNSVQKLRNDVTNVQGTVTDLSGEATRLSDIVTVLADEIGFI